MGLNTLYFFQIISAVFMLTIISDYSDYEIDKWGQKYL